MEPEEREESEKEKRKGVKRGRNKQKQNKNNKSQKRVKHPGKVRQNRAKLQTRTSHNREESDTN